MCSSDLHPQQLRWIAERVGLLPDVSASDAELLRTERGHIAELQRDNDRRKRNMLRLREHALSLQRDLAEHADWKHADLAPEMNAINAVVSLFDMAVDDFADDYTAHEPDDSAAATRDSDGSSPKTDGFEAPPKTGAFGDVTTVTPGHTKQRQNGPGAKGRGADPAGVQVLHPRSKSAAQQLQLEG